MKHSVSIIVPAYNSAHYIAKTIEACLDQDLSQAEAEIIIVDDGSTDNTKEIVSKFPVKYIFQANSGPAKARNKGWRSSSAEIVFFTDADCIPERKWVSRLLSHYDGDEVGAVGGSYGMANKNSLLAQCIWHEILYRHRNMPGRVRVLGSYNMSVRRKVLEELGGFDESFTMASGEDNDLCYRISKKGYSIIFDRDARVGHYHPELLLRYLRTQFWHGYWRVKLYTIHMDMTGGDDYSGLSDYLQPAVALGAVMLLPFFALPGVMEFSFFLVLLEIAMQLPVAVSIALRENSLKYLTLVPITFCRAFSRGIGLFYGVFKFIIMRK